MALTDGEVANWLQAAASRKDIAAADLDVSLTGALKKLYSAVAFDIDGTLTVPDSADLDPAMCKIVARLLRRGCHVWLVTGRGSSGATKAIIDLVDLTDLQPEECLRLRCIAHNGAMVLETDPAHPEEFFRAVRPLIQPFGKVEELMAQVRNTLAEAKIEPTSLTFEPSRADEACGLRVVFTDLAVRDQAVALLAGITDPFGESLRLRTGVYHELYTIDLSTADKALAVSALAEVHRLDPSRVLCIGDQGGSGGNDDTFLASATGFSVGTVSESSLGCFPVASADGEVLTGAVATRRLVDSLCIGAPLRMLVDTDTADSQAQLSRLLKFERAAVRRASVETRTIERQLSLRVAQLIAHDPGDGDFAITVDDLFDPHSGGVRIRDWELHDLKANAAISQLFGFDSLDRATTSDDGPDRCMYTDSGVLLRGPDYYMNLTGRKTAAEVPSYLQRAENFIDLALAGIDELMRLRPNPTLVRVALAIMDNVRDILLQLLNIALFVAQPPGAVDADDHQLVGTLGTLAADHTCRYVDFLLEPHSPWLTTLSNCRQPTDRLRAWFTDHRERLSDRVTTRAGQAEWKAGNKTDIFRWREADYIVQNLSAVVIGLRAVANRRSKPTDEPILAVGLQCGGLELPLLAAALGPRFGLEFVPAAMRVSMYGNHEQGKKARADLDDWVARADPEDFPVAILHGNQSHGPEPTDVVVFDDNCTTGTTVQAARDMLVRRGWDVRAVVIVRFPGANRFQHMALPLHGLLDLDLAHNFVQGLVGPSPYSRLVVPNPASPSPYLDENGVFDKAKQRLQLLLHKNNPNRFAMPEAHPWRASDQP